MPRTPFLWKILERIAPSVGATVEVEPSHRFVGIVRFANGRQSCFWENRLDLNPVAAARIAQDKGYTSHFLRARGFAVPAELAIYGAALRRHVDASRGVEAALAFARERGYPLIVKPNRFSQGRLVERVDDDAALAAALDRVLACDRIALVQEVARGHDLRIVVVDRTVIDAYERVPLTVTGDGAATIGALIERRQREFVESGRDTVIPAADPRLAAVLARQGRGLGTVLPAGTAARLFDIANLSVGGESVAIAPGALHPDLRELAISAAAALNLRFAGVDVMVEDLAAPLGGYTILELNAAPGLDAYSQSGAGNDAHVDRLYACLLVALRDGPPPLAAPRLPIQILRCTTGEPRFQALVRELDADLTARYGEVQALYSPHNKVAEIETAVLALEGGAPVGCGCFKLHAPGTIELKRMFVRPAARGRRIGQQIVEALEAWARELGHTAAALETGNLQPEAVALYARCGYQRTPCFPPYDQLPASICMRKAL